MDFTTCHALWSVKPEDVTPLLATMDEVLALTVNERGSLHYAIGLPDGYENVQDGLVTIFLREGYSSPVFDSMNIHCKFTMRNIMYHISRSVCRIVCCRFGFNL